MPAVKIPARRILLERAEGPSPLPTEAVYNSATRNVWLAAQDVLRRWGLSCPPGMMGVDKTDFTIEFEDGTEYKGTFGLTRNDNDLAAHVRGSLDGMLHPAILKLHANDEEDWEHNVLTFRATYQIGWDAYTNVHTLISGDTWENASESILAILFGHMLDATEGTLTAFRSDLFHDATWLRQNVTGPAEFDWLVRDSGTNIGASALTAVAVGTSDDSKFFRVVLREHEQRWTAQFTRIPLDVIRAEIKGP